MDRALEGNDALVHTHLDVRRIDVRVIVEAIVNVIPNPLIRALIVSGGSSPVLVGLLLAGPSRLISGAVAPAEGPIPNRVAPGICRSMPRSVAVVPYLPASVHLRRRAVALPHAALFVVALLHIAIVVRCHVMASGVRVASAGRTSAAQ
jgi:hypothetical protein